MMVHKRPKLSCPDCEMVFYNAEQLERHKSSHTWKKVRIGVVSGQYRLSCLSTCDSVFQSKCPFCVKSLSRGDALKKHIKDVHKQNPADVKDEIARVAAAADEEPMDVPPPRSPSPPPPPPRPESSLTNDPIFPTAAEERQVYAVYPDDEAEFILKNWRYVRTILVKSCPLLTTRQVRLTVPNDRLHSALSKILYDVLERARSCFKIDLAFTTINKDKITNEMHVSFAEKNSRVFERGESRGPLLITGRDDLPKVLEKLGGVDVYDVS